MRTNTTIKFDHFNNIPKWKSHCNELLMGNIAHFIDNNTATPIEIQEDRRIVINESKVKASLNRIKNSCLTSPGNITVELLTQGQALIERTIYLMN